MLVPFRESQGERPKAGSVACVLKSDPTYHESSTVKC
ncbi:unnamed protein product [Gulo gulo]|uniref:Uncharacterized protein n=1 Tax=Gulo gulo TaxID=48420 RepID=A0A9X9PX83_GULGU|nr:unnamed protein product [Gulo gulo]